MKFVKIYLSFLIFSFFSFDFGFLVDFKSHEFE